MTNIYLYGELRNKFGSEFKFHINSAKEAFLAINANRKGFFDEIKKLATKNIHYRIIVDDQIVENEKEFFIQKAPKEIHIVPIIWGAGNTTKGIVQSVIGVSLIIAGFTIGIGNPAGMFLASTGAALLVGGVMTLLFPPPKPDFNQEVAAGGKSYLFGQKPANTSQGQAVPVGYGRLLVGSSQVSFGLNHYPLKTDIKTLMAPVDRPVDDFLELEYKNEDSPSITLDSFYTNQAMGMDEPLSFASVNILNSYINIITNAASRVTTEAVEVVVKRDGEVVSNPNLTTFDEDIEYQWSNMNTDSDKPKIRIENPYSFDAGIVYRSYQAPDFVLNPDLNVKNTDASFFASYKQNQYVKYGPMQFKNLKFATWDSTYTYVSGELVSFNNKYYQSITGHSNQLPTGVGGITNSTYWQEVISPDIESLYYAQNNVSRFLPSDNAKWTRITTSPQTSGDMNERFDRFGSPKNYEDKIYFGEFKNINENSVGDSNANVDNYGMEFLGYFHVPLVTNRIVSVIDATTDVMYEIIRVGDPTQWANIGLTGENGTPITPVPGITFKKNSTVIVGDGQVYPVVKYKFKLDSDDASDFFIDGWTGSSYYGNHGMFAGFTDPNAPKQSEIEALPSLTVDTLLTVGYHRIYARFQDDVGGEGITVYYKYDSNWDGVYSNYEPIPSSALYHRKSTDLSIPKNQKFMVKNQLIAAPSMINGKKYKIVKLGTVNWGKLGASSPVVGSVFVKTATPGGYTIPSDGFVYEDTFSYYEGKSANSNRIVRFIADRPTIIDQVDEGLSFYQAKYKCNVKLDRVTLNTSPVKINIKFLPTENKFNGTVGATLPLQLISN
jgi:predicted phage tail protein